MRLPTRLVDIALCLAAVVVLPTAFYVATATRSGPAVDTVAVASDAPSPASTRMRPAKISLIGDSLLGSGNKADGFGGGFTPQAAEQYGMQVVSVEGVGGSGYLARGYGGKSTVFAERLERAAEKRPDYLLIEGGNNDANREPGELRAAAAATFAKAKRLMPKVTLIVVGPLFTGEPRDERDLQIRDALKAAATEAGAVYIDPVSSKWIGGKQGTADGHPDRVLIGEDRVHPNPDGVMVLATKLVQALSRAKVAGEVPEI